MTLHLQCNTHVLAETAQAVAENLFLDHTRSTAGINFPIYMPPMSGSFEASTHYAMLTSLDVPPPAHAGLLGWMFAAEGDVQPIAQKLKYLSYPAVLKREMPILKTFTATEKLDASTPPAHTPCILVLGGEASFTSLAEIIPNDFEIIGAYQDTVAEDYLHAKKFDGIVIDKNTIDVNDMRFLRVLHMQPSFVHIPVFLQGFVTLEDAIAAQKQGVSLICPNHWPTGIIQKAVENTVHFARNSQIAKTQLQDVKVVARQNGPRLFSPITQKLFMASLETRLKLSRQSLARGAALVLDITLYPSTTPTTPLAKNTEAHFAVSKQILDLIHHLTRCEDQVFAIDEGRIAIILPATNHVDTMSAGGRFKAILETSRFRPHGTHASLEHVANVILNNIGLDVEITPHVKLSCIPLDMRHADVQTA